MGLLSRMQGKSDGKIQVSVEPEAAGPGDEMVVKFEILEELDDKARTVFAGITCTGRYQVRERYEDNEGRMQTRVVWREYEIYDHQQPCELTHGPQEARFVLPEQAQPGSGKIVEWEAFARVDREKGIDLVETVPFNVRVPLARIPDTRNVDASGEGMTITNVPTAAEEGTTLRGKLVVDVVEDIKARAVSVRLHRRDTHVADVINDYNVYDGNLFFNNTFWSSTSRIVDDEQVAEVDIAEKVSFSPGQRREFEWEIAIPMSGPTSSHNYSQVDWRIEAVLDRRMRGDKAVESPIIVV